MADYLISFTISEINLIKDALSVLGLFVLIALTSLIKKLPLPSWTLRKIDHILFLVYFGILRFFHCNFYDILIVFAVSVALVLFFSVLPPVRLLNFVLVKDTREGEPLTDLLTNLLLTSASLIFVFFLTLDIPWAFIIAAFSLGLGDGLGEVVGKRYGMTHHKFRRNKTLEGSIAVLFGLLLSFVIVFLLYPFLVFTVKNIFFILLVSLVGTLLEAFCVKFMDNLLLPIWMGVSTIVLFPAV